VNAKTASWFGLQFGLPIAEQWEKKSSLETCVSDTYCCWQRQELQLDLRRKKRKKKAGKETGKTPFFQPSYLRDYCCNLVSPESSQ